MIKLVIVLSLICLRVFGFEPAGGVCDPEDSGSCCVFNKSLDDTNVTRLDSLNDVCSLGVTADDLYKSYRRFGFSSDGQLSIYMQPGGTNSRANATQSFLIFPFKKNPTLKLGDSNQFIITTGSGQNWLFDARTSLPVSSEDCDIVVSSSFSISNSGLQIKSCKNHIFAETPIERSGEYISYPNKTLTFKDPSGASCTIKNSDLYHYDTRNRGSVDKRGRHFNIKIKYETNAEMGQAFKNLCPTDFNYTLLLYAD